MGWFEFLEPGLFRSEAFIGCPPCRQCVQAPAFRSKSLFSYGSTPSSIIREILTPTSGRCGSDSFEAPLAPIVPLVLNVLCHPYRVHFAHSVGFTDSVTVSGNQFTSERFSGMSPGPTSAYPRHSGLAAPRNWPQSEAHFRFTEVHRKTVGSTPHGASVVTLCPPWLIG